MLRACMEGNQLFMEQTVRTQVKFAAIAATATDTAPLSKRLLRHMCLLQFPQLSNNSLSRIWQSCLQGGLNECNVNIESDIQHILKSVVDATIAVYHCQRNNIVPDFSTPHYFLGMHDLARVMFAMYTLIPEVTSVDQIPLIWAHEICRELKDRLVQQSERQECLRYIMEAGDTLCSQFGGDISTVNDTIVTVMKSILPQRRRSSLGLRASVTSLMRRASTLSMTRRATISSEISELLPTGKGYALRTLTNNDEMCDVVDTRLAFIRTSHPQPHKLDFIIHPYFARQVLKIGRILQQQRSVIVLGYAGTGRKCSIRAAAATHAFNIMEVKADDDIETVVLSQLSRAARIAGVSASDLVLLLPSHVLCYARVAAAVSSLLRDGTAPGLFTTEDLAEICPAARTSEPMGATPQAFTHYLWNHFYQVVRQHLRIAIVVDMNNGDWTRYIYEYPSLVKKTTVIVHDAWDRDVLREIAWDYLSRECDLGSDTVLVAALCADIHQTAVIVAGEHKDTNCVTSTVHANFLEYLRLFASLLSKVRQKDGVQFNALKQTVETISKLDAEIARLQDIVSSIEPSLQTQQKNTKVELSKVQEHQHEIEDIRAMVLI